MRDLVSAIYQSLERHIIEYRRVVVTAVHLVQAVLANYLAFLLRFEAVMDVTYLRLMLQFLPYLIVIRLVLYLQAGLYKDLWRYASVGDLLRILRTVTIGSIAFVIVVRYLHGETYYPRSIYVLDWLLLVLMSGGSRLFIRVFREFLSAEQSGKTVLLIGAGDAGEMIVRDMKNNPKHSYEPVGFIDIDPYKKGLSIHGVPIYGGYGELARTIENCSPEEILISIPSASQKAIKEIYEHCKPFNLPIRTLPGLSDILDDKVLVSQIRPLALRDLLQREPVRTDIESVRQYVGGKVVMITGAGGSIGSELARQIYEYGPAELLMLDRYENGLFNIDMELAGRSADVRVTPLIGDIMDEARVEYLFDRHKPQIVFHAAAHKHVPLMERNPLEAVKNNIFGTKNIAEAASRHSAEAFVMVSSDKAVNPINVMGATKRVAEFITMDMNRTSTTRFSIVRFGNVLGSNGSVVNIFEAQLKNGGPLTVTHPEMKRFFMLIPEAVQLVLIAASSGKGGEIFVLDMGEPVKILDLAENFIRLSGMRPYEDVDITFIGLRPGEKMYEELFDKTERRVPSSLQKLWMAVPKEMAPEYLQKRLASFSSIVAANSAVDIEPELKKIIPEFRTAGASDEKP